MDKEITAGLGLRKRMLLNTLSNYGKMLIGIGITIFLTRILFLGLSREEYGFWALLWSIFGYSLLLDFGFGTSIQKYTSECSANQEWGRYNRIVSTLFVNYSLFAILIAVFTFTLSFYLRQIFDFSEVNLTYFKRVLIVFGIGSALAFPFGFFAEILRGLQKMHARNLIQTSFIVLNFVGMALMIRFHFNLIGMAFVAIGTNIGASITMMYAVKRFIPQFKIRITYFDRSLLKSIMSFSVFAYLITFSNLIIMKTDQMVISIFGSVTMVAVYQISIRLADTFQKFSSQFLDNIGPVTASLFAAGNKSKMTEILLQSNRLLGMISTMLLIPLLVFIRPLLKLWLNLDDPVGVVCAVILLLSMYTLLFFRSSSVYVLLMADEHKKLTRVAIAEALLNLGLSILLIKTMPSILAYFGYQLPGSAIIGVALGTIIPNVVFAFSFNVPTACSFAGITKNEYYRVVVVRTLFVAAITLIFAVAISLLIRPTTLLTVAVLSIITVAVYILMTYSISLIGWERQQVRQFISNRLRRHNK